VYESLGKNDDALKCYQKSLEISIKTFGNDHPDVASCYHNIAILFDSKGFFKESLDLYFKSLEIKLKTLNNNHPSLTASIKSYCKRSGYLFYKMKHQQKL